MTDRFRNMFIFHHNLLAGIIFALFISTVTFVTNKTCDFHNEIEKSPDVELFKKIESEVIVKQFADDADVSRLETARVL